MTFHVSDEAIRSFQQEWGLKDGQYVRIYAKYSGGGADAFSVGINVSAEPIDPAVIKTIGSYHFFVEKSDEWIIRDNRLNIECGAEGIFFKV
ncbi:hypothetical protein ACX93W_07315 [Paenibacillus sp. CAU 1782]